MYYDIMVFPHEPSFSFQNTSLPNENPGEVRIKIIDSGDKRNVFKCRIKRTQKLRKMMETYANTNKLEMASLRFLFDEKRVHKVRIDVRIRTRKILND